MPATASSLPTSRYGRPVDDWCVLLIGGASGTGKSQVSYPLARRLGLSVLEVDDLVTAIKAATTPDQLPLLHYWDTHPEAHAWSAERIDELTMSVIDTLQPSLDAVIADHLDTNTRVIVEGDYLLPSLAADRAGVRGVILHEPDVDQLVRNFAMREPDSGIARTRAEVSALLGAHLATQAATLGVPVVPARPWSTALDRTAAALELTPRP
jgi:2-phosphoglycerate kinase